MGIEEELRDDTTLGGRRDIPQARLLIPLEADRRQPEFTFGGKQVCFTAAPHAGEDSDLRSMVHRVSVTGGEPVLVIGGVEATWAWLRSRFSHDGRTLFLLAEHPGESGLDSVESAKAVAALAIDTEPGTESRIPTDPVTSDHEASWSSLKSFGERSVPIPVRV